MVKAENDKKSTDQDNKKINIQKESQETKSQEKESWEKEPQPAKHPESKMPENEDMEEEISEEKYAILYEQLSDYAKHLHEMNQHRIKIGLRCFLSIPTIFLALLFMTGSNKIMFLILWIISLFALSFYLIVVEYLDYHLQIKLNEWSEEEQRGVENLIGIDLRDMRGNIRQAFREWKQEVTDEKHT